MDNRLRPGRLAASGVALVGLLSLAACGHHAAAPAPAPSSSGGAGAPAHAAPTTVTYRSVTGTLPSAKRKHLATQLGGIVDRWWAAEYLTGTPARSFPGFTPAAAKLAAAQRPITTSARAHGVPSPVSRSVALDVLAVHKSAVGATATVNLVYRAGAKYRVHGTVSLTPGKHGWQIFAFDLTQTTLGGAR